MDASVNGHCFAVGYDGSDHCWKKLQAETGCRGSVHAVFDRAHGVNRDLELLVADDRDVECLYRSLSGESHKERCL